MRRSIMIRNSTVLEQLEHSIRTMTHGRVRDLLVEEVQGRFVVQGSVPTYYAKQLAIRGAMKLLPSDRFDMNILVS